MRGGKRDSECEKIRRWREGLRDLFPAGNAVEKKRLLLCFFSLREQIQFRHKSDRMMLCWRPFFTSALALF